MYNSDDLSHIPDYKNIQGQTSGHSFGNGLKYTSDGRFTGLDIGDNYPRGINFWSMTVEDKWMKTIYSFKTLHDSNPVSPAGRSYGKYEEISSEGHEFYKWSNDNNVYTELSAPGFEEMKDGFNVFFVGERPALDNALTGDLLNVPRNIGFVKTDLLQDEILSDGPVEKGGFYTFNGAWTSLEHEGIEWLTDFPDLSSNVSRLKTAKISEDKIFLMFEVWTPDQYRYTSFMYTDGNGKPLGPHKNLCYPLRLEKADDMVVGQDGKISIYSGAEGGKIAVYKITAF